MNGAPFDSQFQVLFDAANNKETTVENFKVQLDADVGKGFLIDQKNDNKDHPHTSAYSLLGWAAGAGNLEIVKLLVEEKDANIEGDASESENSPLYRACAYNHPDIVTYLISKGANINRKNSNGLTCLHIASYNNYSDIVKILLDKGANINAVDNNQNTPLIYAVKNASDKTTSQLLARDPPPNIDLKNTKGQTALSLSLIHI